MKSYSVVELNVYDNTDKTCVNCKTFGETYIYCPVFNFIEGDPNIKFDETGELNGCELYNNRRQRSK